MFTILSEMFSYQFLVRAVIVGAMVSLCAALLGVSLVLKRYSMIGDGLSHVGFGALALATGMNLAPLTVSIPVVLAAAFLLLRLSESSKVKGDAAIAIISTGSIAVGVFIISRTTGMNTDVCNYLFGSILAMSKSDVYLSVILSALVLGLFVFFYNKLFAISFDETFARATGVKAGNYNMVIALLTAVTIVLGMRMMGAMLISSLIVFPALSSMRIFKTWRSVTFCSALVSLVCFFAGLVVSYLYATPTGASVVIMNIAAFLLFWLLRITAGKLRRIKSAGKAAGAVGIMTCLIFVSAVLPSSCAKPWSSVGKKNLAGTQSVNLPGGFSTGTGSFTAPEPGSSSGSNSSFLSAPETVSISAPETASISAPKAGKEESPGPIVEIKEKMFIAQTNDVYLNAEDYLGRIIKLEGLFKREQYLGEDAVYCFVLRYGPGCCGNDGNAGFEVAWDAPEGEEPGYPAVDEWVEAVGTLKTYEEDGYPYLYLSLSSLRVLEERGAEFVTQ
jgi:zinc transport system permease protein